MFKASDYFNVLQQIERFFVNSAAGKPVIQPLDPVDLRTKIDLDLPREGMSLIDLQSEITDYLTHAVKTAHPSYFNQLWGGFSAPCFMGDMVSSVANTSMYTYEVAPVATAIEKTLVAKMGKLVGFDNPEGQFTTGGSNGNLMAMAIARHQAIPALKQEGMTAAPQLIAFVSEDAHYSFAKAASLLGLGSSQVWKIPVDDRGKMRVSELERLISAAREQNVRPFFVAATAGTTVRGAYDPFAEIAAIARREKLWFHVDGAWGASVLLSETHRHLMQGAEQADSVVWDAHKMMGMTLMCSILLVKQRGMMANAFSSRDTDYLFHTEEEEPMNLGNSTIHCGRRVDALKLWLAWKHLGDRGWEALVDRYFMLAARSQEIIESCESLELVVPRESLNICFQYIPKNPQFDPNDLTLKVRQVLLSKGIAMVNYAKIGEKVVFRLVICNNQTRLADLEAFFEALLAIARQLESNIKSG
ncbi:MAG: aminotransferase class V-fold PLP-dependent enzyme [Cyanobacteria bacterium SBLK]|nr:aminotransferase class V-fold PLP-dependent enzyme [Cyanobacteria bacterium SBLK]